MFDSGFVVGTPLAEHSLLAIALHWHEVLESKLSLGYADSDCQMPPCIRYSHYGVKLRLRQALLVPLTDLKHFVTSNSAR